MVLHTYKLDWPTGGESRHSIYPFHPDQPSVRVKKRVKKGKEKKRRRIYTYKARVKGKVRSSKRLFIERMHICMDNVRKHPLDEV